MYLLRILLFFSSFILVFPFASGVIASESLPDDFSAMLPSDCVYWGDFQQKKTVPMLKKDLVSDGKLLYHCEKGLVWAVISPVEQIVVYGVKGDSYLIAEQAKPEKLKGRVHRELGKLLHNLVGGDMTYLAANFTVAPDSDTVESPNVFTLRPKKKRMAKFIANIRFDFQNIESDVAQAVNIQVAKTDGEHLEMTIFNVNILSSLSVSDCTYLDASIHTSCHFLVDR